MTTYTHNTGAQTTAYTLTQNKEGCAFLETAQEHQISLRTTGGTGAGTFAVTAIPLGCSSAEALTISGAAVNLPHNATFGPFDGLFESITVTPSGTDCTSFELTFAGG